MSAVVVPPPFDDTSDGDCVLVTPDGTRFKVHRLVLRLASPFFADMFSLPQNPNEPPSEIQIAEDPQTVLVVLGLMYPVEAPKINDFDLAMKVVKACDKYLISLNRLRTVPSVRGLLVNSQVLKQHALQAYGLAWRLGMDEEAKTASRHLHNLDLRAFQTQTDLARLSGSLMSLVALWDLRLRREEGLEAVLESLPLQEWACPTHGGLGAARNGMGQITMFHVDTFLHTRSSAKIALRRALNFPYPRCVDVWTAVRVGTAGCEDCPGPGSGNMADADRLGRAIDRYPQTIAGLLEDPQGS